MKLAEMTRASVMASALLCSMTLAVPAQAAGFVSLSKDNVMMRAGPGRQHEALWRLPKGYPLKVTSRRGRWVKVRDVDRDTGWVYSPLTHAVPHHIVSAEVANVRAGPGVAYRIVGKAYRGEIVRTERRQRQWVKVRREEGRSGWISRSLLWGW